jgi:hypothetical protein
MMIPPIPPDSNADDDPTFDLRWPCAQFPALHMTPEELKRHKDGERRRAKQRARDRRTINIAFAVVKGYFHVEKALRSDCRENCQGPKEKR